MSNNQDKLKLIDKRLVKVVRDKIGQDLQEHPVVYEKIRDEEIVEALHKKLLEEVGEFLVDKNVEELADVLTVVIAVAHHEYDMTLDELMEVVEKKNKARGSFQEGWGMYAVPKDKYIS